MGHFIARMLVKSMVGRLLQKVDVGSLLNFVDEAEEQYDNQFAKRGHVYRAIKAVEPEDISNVVVNLAIELGVYFYKKLL